MTLFILENKWRDSSDDSVREGTTLVRSPDEPTARARRPMLVCAIIVKGSPKNVEVRLGDEVLRPGPGTTPLVPPRQIEAGAALAIDFAGDGAVEIAADRETVNKPKAAAV